MNLKRTFRRFVAIVGMMVLVFGFAAFAVQALDVLLNDSIVIGTFALTGVFMVGAALASIIIEKVDY